MISLIYIVGIFALVLASDPQVEIDGLGTVEGSYETYGSGDQVAAFRGIPFAAPPVGDLRFEPPADVESWDDVLETKQFTAQCMQTCNLPLGFCSEETSEDCLYLNIFTPSIDEDAQLPVALFIPGGAFQQGSGSSPIYDGVPWVSRHSDFVLVTISYRVGVFGNFIFKDVWDGNQGIKDQVKAMEWVRDYIHHFGGNPDTVTLMGESAGATSVSIHMMNEHSRSLFHRAIMQSNPLGIRLRTRKNSKKLSKKVWKKKLELTTADKLRAVSAEELMEAGESISIGDIKLIFSNAGLMVWSPHVDKDLVMGQPMKKLNSDHPAADMPVLLGTNTDEGDLLLKYSGYDYVKKFMYNAIVIAFAGVGHDQRKTLELYPKTSGDNFDPLADFVGDWAFTCATRYTASRLNDAYLYYFEQHLSFNPWDEQLEVCADLACHGVELAYIFNTIESLDEGDYKFTDAEKELVSEMQEYWTHFIRYGSVDWDNYDTTDRPTMRFSADDDAPTGEVYGYRTHECDTMLEIGFDTIPEQPQKLPLNVLQSAN